jgi:hypothetical protein
MSEVLRKLKENNEYPIVFIGSGMSRRYLKDFPSWEELLKQFWDQLNTRKDFYGFLNSLRNQLKDRFPADEYDLDYLTNIHAGSEIEEVFNKQFFDQKIDIPNFSQEKAYKSGISPFKVAISNRFSSYEIKSGMEEEYKAYKNFLNKTQIIVTTNYDTLIEDSINSISHYGAQKYVGQNGFFEQTYGWAEVYKIHGCVEDPESIVISKTGYEKFEKNSILISAKIISLLIHSPIIFMGYSLTDSNVRKIIKDFSSSLSREEIKRMSSKIIIIERQEELTDIVEQTFFDKDLGCEYTVLRTDNFQKMCEILTEIDQGIHPSEVRKYQHVIKQLIVDRGRRGSLNSLLLSPGELEDIEKRIGDERLVVALGDTAYIFEMPDLMSYLCDYFFDVNGIHTDIALRFVASQNSTSRIPFIKYVNGVDLDQTNLHPFEIEKLKQRVARYTTPEYCINSISTTYRIKATSLNEILEFKHKPDKEYEIISYNCKRINRDELDAYIKEKLGGYKTERIRSLSTPFRRLLMIYDLLINQIK